MPNFWCLQCNASRKQGNGVGLLVSYAPYLTGGIFNGAFFLLQNLLFPHPPWTSPVILFSARAGEGGRSFSTRSLRTWQESSIYEYFQHCRLGTTTTASDLASYHQRSKGSFCSTDPIKTLTSKSHFQFNLLANYFVLNLCPGSCF